MSVDVGGRLALLSVERLMALGQPRPLTTIAQLRRDVPAPCTRARYDTSGVAIQVA